MCQARYTYRFYDSSHISILLVLLNISSAYFFPKPSPYTHTRAHMFFPYVLRNVPTSSCVLFKIIFSTRRMPFLVTIICSVVDYEFALSWIQFALCFESVNVLFNFIMSQTRLCIHLHKPDIAVAMEIERSKIRGVPVQSSLEISDYTLDRPQGLFREFLYDVNPISREDWEKSSRLLKTVLVIRSPFMFLLQLFIPVVNPTVVKRGWSKLLNCFQLCVTPTIALLLLDG